MLKIVESQNEKLLYQRQFNKLITSEWTREETRRVVWRPDHRDLEIAHNGKLWFVSDPPGRDQKVKRFWNSFGVYHPDGNLFITVEVNIAIASNAHDISGFFARDMITGFVYLMHDGGVGGGKKGVGREAFLAWSSIKPIPCEGSDGRIRPGILVAPLRKGKVSVAASAFVERIAKFKRAVANGTVPTGTAAKKIQDSYRDYWREFSGKKRGQRAKEIEYYSRHGDVVDELTRWRPADTKKGERLVKNGLIDLGIELNQQLRVLFEVKTSAGRQDLYTAIGQILVHGRQSAGLQSYIVVPAGERVTDDISKALERLGVRVVCYALHGERVKIVER